MTSLVLAWAACTPPSGTGSPTPTGSTTTPGTGGTTTASCRIDAQTTTYAGHLVTYTFSYPDSQAIPSLITASEAGAVQNEIEIGAFSVTDNRTDDVIVATVYDAAFGEYLPSKGDVSLTIDGVEERNYATYFFEYDERGRVVLVGQQTNNNPNDGEYDLTIAYDDDDNVVELVYFATTGPRDAFTAITVDAYDDHPTPHAKMGSAWKFLTATFDWGSPDPFQMLAALSAHNPLDYTIDMSSEYAVDQHSTLTYTYGPSGQPVSIHHQSDIDDIAGVFTLYDETFTYQCP